MLMALCDAVLHGSRRSFYQLSSNDEGGAYVDIYGEPSEGIWRCLVHFCALILRWCMMILLAVLQGCLFPSSCDVLRSNAVLKTADDCGGDHGHDEIGFGLDESPSLPSSSSEASWNGLCGLWW